MKTIKQLKNNRDRLVREMDAINTKETLTRSDASAIRKAMKEIALIDLCVRYLETDPDEGFVEAQIKKNEQRDQDIISQIRILDCAERQSV